MPRRRCPTILATDSEDYIFFLMGAGPAILTWGLFRLREKRILENIPVSKVRSAAMGLVELCGTAKPRKEISDPITGRKCCWWSCKIQEYVSNGRNSNWRTVKTAASHEPFYFQDETGMVMVDAAGAELYIGEQTMALGEEGRAKAATALGVSVTTLFGGAKRLRAKLQRILPNDRLTVMGELAHRVDYLEERKARFQERLAAVKKDPKQMAQADTNHDGRVDPEEWDAFRAKFEADFLAEEGAREGTIPDCEKLVVKDPVEQPFVLATESREQLISALAWKSMGGVGAGIVGTGLGVGLAQLNGYSLETTTLLAALGSLVGCIVGVVGRKGGASWSWLSWL